MRIVELLSGISIPVTNEEKALLKKFKDGATLRKKELDPREQVVINSLVQKDIILRQQNNGQITYVKKIS